MDISELSTTQLHELFAPLIEISEGGAQPLPALRELGISQGHSIVASGHKSDHHDKWIRFWAPICSQSLQTWLGDIKDCTKAEELASAFKPYSSLKIIHLRSSVLGEIDDILEEPVQLTLTDIDCYVRTLAERLNTLEEVIITHSRQRKKDVVAKIWRNVEQACPGPRIVCTMTELEGLDRYTPKGFFRGGPVPDLRL